MESDVRSYVDSFSVCQQYKRLPAGQPGKLTPIPLPETIFLAIGVDYIGHVSITTAGNRYIIVAVEYLSKYLEVAAVLTLPSCHLTDFLKLRFEWRHGLPKKIISGRATTFCSRELRNYLSTAGVRRHYTSAFHP